MGVSKKRQEKGREEKWKAKSREDGRDDDEEGKRSDEKAMEFS